MRIESAFYTSGSGLTAHGQAISVVGDNISNTSTVAYKVQRVSFSDLWAEGPEARQTSATEPTGAGVSVTKVQQVFDTGVLDFTGRNLDVAIEGNGFFAVGETSNPEYTRAGNFIIDENGYLSNSQGQNVIGYTGDGTTLGQIDMLSLDLSGSPTTASIVTGNLNSTEEVIGVEVTNPLDYQDIGQNSNFVNNFTAYDSLGVGHEVTLAYTKMGTNTWAVQAFMDSGDLGGTAGIPQQIGNTATLAFGQTGFIAEDDFGDAVITANPQYSTGSAPGFFSVDLSGFTQFGATTNIKSLSQDGEATGDVDTYEFRGDGRVMAILTGGTEVQIGQVPIAVFSNVEGLARSGSGLYTSTDISGDAQFGTAGTTIYGELQGGALERSNVDIGNQFVDLVVLQRGYQANSQVFSSTNDIVRDTINLLR